MYDIPPQPHGNSSRGKDRLMIRRDGVDKGKFMKRASGTHFAGPGNMATGSKHTGVDTLSSLPKGNQKSTSKCSVFTRLDKQPIEQQYPATHSGRRDPQYRHLQAMPGSSQHGVREAHNEYPAHHSDGVVGGRRSNIETNVRRPRNAATFKPKDMRYSTDRSPGPSESLPDLRLSLKRKIGPGNNHEIAHGGHGGDEIMRRDQPRHQPPRIQHRSGGGNHSDWKIRHPHPPPRD